MSENDKLANSIKEKNKKRGAKAASAASATIGKIEQTTPLIISTENGEYLYEAEEDEIIMTKTFYNETKKKGNEVLVVPVGNLNTIAVIGLIRR